MYFSAFEWFPWQWVNHQCTFPRSQPLSEGPNSASLNQKLPLQLSSRGPIFVQLEDTQTCRRKAAHPLNHSSLNISLCNPTQTAHSISFLMKSADK